MERLQQYPQIFYAGYTQDAIKEYVEAAITYSIIFQLPLPTPQELNVNYEPYLLGLAEANGELRRHCLDILRSGYSEKAEIILSIMDDIYSLLITLDYPEAVTGGLRRVTDLVRSINERTRGEITIILRESQLEEKLTLLSNKLQYGHSEA
jgi:translin